MKLRNMASYVGALALGAVLVAGCQESVTTAPDGTATNDEALFRAYVVDMEVAPTLGTPTTLEAAVAALEAGDDGVCLDGRGHDDGVREDGREGPPPGGDRGGDRGGDNGGKGRGPAFGRDLRSVGYLPILKRLDLTEDQWGAIRTCFEAHRACVEDAREDFRAAAAPAREAYKAEVMRIRNAVKDGSMTREEAREALADARETLRTANQDAVDAYRAAVAECNSTLESCIEGNLTEEQLELWNEWKDRRPTHDRG